VLCALGVCSPAAAATFTVDRYFGDAVDAAPGNGACAAIGGGCTLRAAVQESNALAGADAIVLRSGSVSTLTIAPGLPGLAESGDLDLTGPVSIATSGSGLAVVNWIGPTTDRVFDVHGAIAVSLSHLLIAGGQVNGAGGGGVRVANGASLTALGVVVDTNRVTGSQAGGGIQVTHDSRLTLRDSAVKGNDAGGDGGGIDVADAAAVTVERSQISDNSADSGAAVAMSSTATLSISDTTIVADSNDISAATGAGILQTAGVLSIDRATFTSANGGGRVGLRGTEATVRGSILSGSGGGPMCAGAVTSAGFNVGDGSCDSALTKPGDQPFADPKLGFLVDNGGPTLTMALGASSAARDTGGACGPARDQRGGVRPQGGACDAGAFEVGSLADVQAVSLTASVPALVAGGEFSVQATVRNNGPDAATTPTVTLPLPAGAAFVSGGSCVGSPAAVTCASGTIAAGNSVVVPIALRASAPGALALTATVANAAQGDIEAANDQASTSLTVTPAAVILPFVSPPGPPPPITLRLLGLRASPTTFRVPRVSKRRRAGTTIRFSLTLPARVTITVTRRSRGRWRSVATQARERRAGRHAVRFTDIVRRRLIVPGRYRIVVRVRGATGTLPSSALRVRVLPARR